MCEEWRWGGLGHGRPRPLLLFSVLSFIPCSLSPASAHVVRGCGTPHTCLGVVGRPYTAVRMWELLKVVGGCGTLSHRLGVVGPPRTVLEVVGPLKLVWGW